MLLEIIQCATAAMVASTQANKGKEEMMVIEIDNPIDSHYDTSVTFVNPLGEFIRRTNGNLN